MFDIGLPRTVLPSADGVISPELKEVLFVATGQTVTLSEMASVVVYGLADMRVPEYTADVVRYGMSCVRSAALTVGVVKPSDVVWLDSFVVVSSGEADWLDTLLIAYVIQLQAELKAVLWRQFEKLLGMDEVELSR